MLFRSLRLEFTPTGWALLAALTAAAWAGWLAALAEASGLVLAEEGA